MAFAITQSCCSDAGCVSVCPVGCIHPAPGEPGFGTADILHIDPEKCIDCGACADACPVDAIFPIDRLGVKDAHFAEVNAAYYRDTEVDAGPTTTQYARLPRLPQGLHIAIVGTGPSAGYALRAVLNRTTAAVTVIDKLPTPGGLIRSGVAPDHPATKNIMHGFDLHLRDPRVTMLGGVEIGTDVAPSDLADHFDAVVYAVGASEPRRLGIEGENLAGSTSATEVVAWYNGIPDVENPLRPATVGRTVLVGTGNVALDIARLFHTSSDALRRTDIADRSLPFFDENATSEIVLLGRRGPETAAYTKAEFAALTAMPDVEIVTLDAADVEPETFAGPPEPGRRRVVFVFGTAPVEVVGDDATMTAVRVRSGDREYAIAADNLISSIGYRTRPIEGLPFDGDAGMIPSRDGRVVDGDEVLRGSYVVGWAKRGPSGGIGANRACAEDTVQAVIDDIAEGRVPRSAKDGGDFEAFLKKRGVSPIRRRGIATIDRVERERGRGAGRPRVKLTSAAELTETARRRRRRRG
ncbi:FAD-dependent oxidoreductase [Williamsia deligens]|uniref:ferredoxin--NADP(+) reductase n=1 Tax=Williamsia deligens TaxID=321325 RepID=A0ABW3G722_9NOCA|nr:FAD-dependent oxidoreductase [Williamsia deligens]MCP2193338.1 ferredoxin--NADP+ reductase [Williamsia deligens]